MKWSRKLDEQQTMYTNLLIHDAKIQKLKGIICKYKKSLEQEGLHLL